MTRTTSSPTLPASRPSSRRTPRPRILGTRLMMSSSSSPARMLLNDARPHQVHSLPAGHLPRPPNRRLDAVGHERVRRVACGHRSGNTVGKDDRGRTGTGPRPTQPPDTS